MSRFSEIYLSPYTGVILVSYEWNLIHITFNTFPSTKFNRNLFNCAGNGTCKWTWVSTVHSLCVIKTINGWVTRIVHTKKKNANQNGIWNWRWWLEWAAGTDLCYSLQQQQPSRSGSVCACRTSRLTAASVPWNNNSATNITVTSEEQHHPRLSPCCTLGSTG